MAHKPVAIVAAMRVELAPLLGKRQPQQVDGVELFELPDAVVAIGGIGEKCARHAAEVVIESCAAESCWFRRELRAQSRRS